VVTLKDEIMYNGQRRVERVYSKGEAIAVAAEEEEEEGKVKDPIIREMKV
jgi:hypothetical protein